MTKTVFVDQLGKLFQDLIGCKNPINSCGEMNNDMLEPNRLTSELFYVSEWKCD